MYNRLIFGLIGIVIGAFLMHWLFFPEVKTETVVETRVETDSSFYEYKERYLNDSINSVALIDSINHYIEKYSEKLKDKNIVIVHDTIPINHPSPVHLTKFSGFKPFLYGNIRYSGIVAGELLEIDLENEFRLPTVTNTITKTKTVTNTISPRGLYLGASINTELVPSVGASYLDKDWMINYDYTLKTKSHSVGIRKKLF